MQFAAQTDVQASAPTLHVSLSRVGVTGVEKVIRVNDQLFSANLECFVDLGPKQKGAHMSRFEETVNDAIGEAVLGSSVFRAEERATRRLIGVAAQGMTACPCAQQLVAASARERLSDDGFTDDEIGRILDHV